MDYEITIHQIKTIHANLPLEIKQDKELKAELISQFTGDEKKTSTKDLTFLQANDLIYFLYYGESPTNAAWATFDGKNKQHRLALHYCHRLDWHKNEARSLVDLEKFGAWLKKYGYLHKPLRAYNSKELSKLLLQLERTMNSYLDQKSRKATA